jgi:outer membrane protein assembly factor BamB
MSLMMRPTAHHVVVALALAAGVLLGAGRDGEWVAAREEPGLPRGDQATDCPRGGKAGELLWAFPSNGQVFGAPAIAEDGTLFVGTLGNQLYGVSCRGEQRWRFNMPLVGGRSVIAGSPVLHTDRRIFVGSASNGGGVLLTISSDGTAPNTTMFGGSILASVLVDPEDRVFIGSSGLLRQLAGSIAVFSREIVTLPGFPIVTNPITASPVYLHDNRVVFVSSNLPAEVSAIGGTVTATTVFPVRRTSTPTASPTRTSSATPTASRTAVPTATATATVRAPDDPPTLTPRPHHWSVYMPQADNGTVELTAARNARSRRVAAPAQRATSTAPPFPTSTVIAPSTGVRLAHLHIITNAQALGKAFALSESQATSVIATGEVVIVTLAEQPPRMVALAVDSDPPVILWEHFSSGEIAGSPVLGDLDPSTGRVELIYADSTGILVSLSVPGTPLAGGMPTFNWAIQLDHPAVSAPALGDTGMVYVATANSVNAYSRTDGSPSWTFDWRVVDDDPTRGSITGAIMLAPGGTLYVGTQRHVLAISTESQGLDPDARWPALRRDERNSGWAAP